MATEVRWSDGNVVIVDSEVRWSDGNPYLYYLYEEPAGTEYRIIYHNHYWQMRMV